MSPTIFTLSATPGADIWKKPPSHDVFDAPTTLSQSKPFPLSQFKSTRITFSADWRVKFDQAGVVLVIQDGAERMWIKAGLELYNGEPKISFVGCDRYADWSVHQLKGDSTADITVELRREGQALWAYELILDAQGDEVERHPFRECTWLWANEPQRTVHIGAMCARPTKGDDLGNLEVQFKTFAVQQT